MSAKIFEFKKTEKSSKAVTIVEEKSNLDIFKDVLDEVLGEWQQAAAFDKLNEYIHLKVQTKGKVILDYVSNLNVCSKIEQKLNMRVAIFYPGCTSANQVGWLAGFHRGKEVFATPPDMASEAYARALNIVLCITFEHTLKTLNRS